MSITKKDIVEVMANASGITKARAEEAFEAAFKTIINEVGQGEKVSIQGFGTFDIKIRSARKARNLKTNEEMFVPEKKVISFKPYGDFKAAVENNK